MADNIRIELDLKGLNELMTSPGIVDAVSAAAEAVAAQASSMSGENYGSSVKTEGKKWVAIGNVFPDSKGAAKDNYMNNTLEKAVGTIGLRRHKGG